MSTSQERPSFVSSIDVVAGAGPINTQPAGEVSNAEIASQLRQLTDLTAQLVTVSQEHLQIARRAEERLQKQQQMQRNEFERWLGENRSLKGRCSKAEEAVRALLGDAITSLVHYAEEHEEDLLDSDYLRTEIVDRFGSLLNHVSSMYSLLKRLAEVDRSTSSSSQARTDVPL